MHITKIVFGATRRVMTGKHGNKNFYKGIFCLFHLNPFSLYSQRYSFGDNIDNEE